ncbi:hypothetical protein EKO27_g10173 [Xylaria grammica]|uniref:2,6-dihydroxypyridine 3-monooxygenase substrate binding domain-containing protein n=1 Tax=Xylaria grammica TaxID=363999 RepID=A0A439CS49_9PEZI|nr:hypothetical protein EKO27_g10173 [Xylaria grammica]
MRHGPNRLIFNSAQALQDIYGDERVIKSHVCLLTIQANGVDSIFNAVDRRRHASKRRLIGRAVTDRAMHQFEPIMIEQIDVFLKTLYESSLASRPVDMTQSCKRLGLDIVGHLAFGFALNTQTEPKYRFIIDGIAMGNYRANSFMQLPFLKNRVLDVALHLLSRPRRLGYLRALEHMISSRLGREKHEKNDLYSSVADYINADGPDSIKLSELWSEAVFFFPAGGDTTATALSALFFYLSRNPEAYHKLSDEVRSTFTDGADIKGGPKLAACRYLRSCIDETLRMSSPVSGTLWRGLAREEEGRGPWTVDGHIIPNGTQVDVNIYSLHHNEDYFPNPFSFRPERWLVDNDEELRRVHSAFADFSTRARGCAGKPMAYLESSLVAAKTLWYFDFETAPGDDTTGGQAHPEEFQLRDVFSAAHDGPNLVFKPRVHRNSIGRHQEADQDEGGRSAPIKELSDHSFGDSLQSGWNCIFFVVGGSLAGLMHGIMFKRMGSNVMILEQDASPERRPHSAGIGFGFNLENFLSVSGPAADLDRRWGSDVPQRDASLRLGTVRGHESMVVHFRDVLTEKCDSVKAELVIGADGIHSTVRKLLKPMIRPRYAGYIVWRAMVPENEVSIEIDKFFSDRAATQLLRNSYIVCYLIPTDDGCFEPGKRVINWLWYYNVDEGSPEMTEIFTDIQGQHHKNTVPAGLIRPEVWEKHRDQMLPQMAAPFANLIRTAKSPFVTKVNDVLCTDSSFFKDRVILRRVDAETTKPRRRDRVKEIVVK